VVNPANMNSLSASPQLLEQGRLAGASLGERSRNKVFDFAFLVVPSFLFSFCLVSAVSCLLVLFHLSCLFPLSLLLYCSLATDHLTLLCFCLLLHSTLGILAYGPVGHFSAL
jgi:hypothetical protein